MNQHQDYYYVKGLLDDDCAIVEEIYKKYRPLIIGIVKRMKGNEADGEGVFQEGLLVVLKLALDENFKLTCPFLGLLKPICRNKWIDELKRRDKLRIGGSPENIEEIPDWDNIIPEKITWEKRSELLWDCINKLSEKNKSIFRLRLRDRKKFNEIDTILNYSCGGARVAFCRCKIKLTKCIFGSRKHALSQKEEQNF